MLRKVLALPRRELVLLSKAVAAIGVTWILLWICGVQRLRRMLTYLAKAGSGEKARTVSAEMLTRIISAAARHAPIKGTCLSQALATEALFLHYGYDPVVRLGVMRRNGNFQAHAWVELDNRIIIGGPAMVQEYTPLSSAP